MRTGVGYDSHRFDETRPLVLGGVSIPDTPGLKGHSDGDAVAHAITDAVLGAAGLGDIGAFFPDTDPAYEGADSIELLASAVCRLREGGFRVVNVDATVIAERPRIGPHAEAMRERLGRVLGTGPDGVSVKGKSNEGMGWIGRGEGLAVIAVATVAGAAGDGD
ncbi:2-C-methyl-D-erythritol 2,4-cyclodiphosphate synthase [Candidatus Palauibacter sp.]|uniref:2-C-methyl-D-erythritol 2,4-cyclodiphosphate synthase n=1 Tax=Candidatus Palauibacter sp. TaxID=3101350 RepID=UPI003B5BCC0F